ncbi:TPA: fimbrial protein [Enterobacter cancerogenus]
MLTSVLLISPAQSDSEVKFHGTLMAASCSPDAVNVEFGEVSLDNITAMSTNSNRAQRDARSVGIGVQYFDLSLNCSGTINGIKLKWSGTVADFAPDYLATDMKGLAIGIADENASLIPPDQWKDLGKDARTKKMMAILERDGSATFAGGEFNSTATLTIQVP